MSTKTVKDTTTQEGVTQPDIAPSESAQIRVLSNEDSLVADLVKEQPTVEQIAQIKITRQRQPNLLELPEECLSLQGKQYQFAWLTKGKDLSVKLRTNGWVLCNRTNSPYIKSHRFGVHGAVEQSGMLLAFMPQRLYEEMSMIPVKQSQDRVKHYTKDIFENQDKDAPITFYKPDLEKEKD
jgi:hypothetical protein